jgi:hypothetical protein
MQLSFHFFERNNGCAPPGQTIGPTHIGTLKNVVIAPD